MRRAIAIAAVVALLVPGMAAASPTTERAADSCMPATSQVFAQFGDDGWYFLTPGGGFESGSPAWALAGGARTVKGNESLPLGGKGVSALSLPAGSSATSPWFCVQPEAPTMRFLLRNAGASSSRLALDALYVKKDGTIGSVQVGSFSGTSVWQPSPITYYFLNLLAIPSPSGTIDVAFRFRPLDAAGAWTVDNVYVDPFKRG